MTAHSIESSILNIFQKYTFEWCAENEHFNFTFFYDNQDFNSFESLQKSCLMENSFNQLSSKIRKRPLTLDQLTDGKQYSVIVRSSEDIRLYPSFKELILSNPVESPDYFFIFENPIKPIVYKNGDEVVISSPLKHYLEICKIWKLLSNKADDSDNNSMLFLYRKKLKITSRYNEEMLEREFDGLTNFCDTMENDDTDKTEKNHILQNVLFKFLFCEKEEDRFSYLLSNFSKFENRFDDDYQAYIVGFSFKELRVEYEEKYREYIQSINESISSGITKTFAIPASIYLTSTRVQSIQTANERRADEIFAANIGIGFISLAVTVFIFLMVINELHSLKALQFEYKSLMERLEEKSTPAYKKVEQLSIAIKDRIAFAKNVFLFIGLITALHSIISIAWIYSRSTTHYLPSLHSNPIQCITNFLTAIIKAISWAIN